MNKMIQSLADLNALSAAYKAERTECKWRILVCGGAGCISSGCAEVERALRAQLEQAGLLPETRIEITGCMGLCAVGPVMLIQPGDIFYINLDADRVAEIVDGHLVGGKIAEEYTFYDPELRRHVPEIHNISFFKEQVRIALRNCGQMEHASLPAYISRDGYAALSKVLTSMSPAQVVEALLASGLRGRGGAGFPTGRKWAAGLAAPKGQKYLVCNADEGDPGAFMDRSLLEGDPHGVIEGMLIGGYTIGADKGYVYVRAEYPLAIERLGKAIDQAREAGLLGTNILGSGFSFDLEIRIGAGAFVCGEETALLESIEGKRGEPRQKPPFPFEAGLFGKPTIINNVETLANVAPILLNGAAWYAGFGTEKSKGTKVFALAGDVVNAGIIEVPMGTTLGDIIYKIGGGLIGGKQFKAIQSGGPSGGCLTTEHLNVSVDYESLSALGAIMGSGGLIVMDADTCMVDTARYFMDFIQEESCGKCLPCRVGTKRMLEILLKITEGRGEPGDIEKLEELAGIIKDTAMCGLGQTASNPVLSTLRYFRAEYETHIYDKHCEAGVCAELYTAPCQNACPASVNVPGYLVLLASGRPMDAYALIRQDNPFPAVCGRVCTHPCESHCRRGQVDEAVSICHVKRFIGDYALRDDFDIPTVVPHPPTRKNVAVIGSGPSGLTCAYYLAHLGHTVDVYEADEVAGGVLYWGIPEYRLPNAVLEKEIRAIEAAGVRIHTNTRIGQDVDFKDLQRENDAVYIAIGSQLSKKLGIPGEDTNGVESGLSFLRRIGLNRDRSAGKRLAVIGGGSTAMDVARTARRLGAEEVTIVYRRTLGEMPAGILEAEAAMEEGVKIEYLVSPLEILSKDGKVTGVKCVRRHQGEYGDDGRKKTYATEGSEFVISCDGVISAVNQEPDFALSSDDSINAKVTINKFTSQTENEGVFAGGDISPWGANIVISAIADGKRAAANIDKYLGGSGILNKGEEIIIPDIYDDEVAEHDRFPHKVVASEERLESFCEVECGYHKLDAMAEALRCLRCDRR